MKRKQEPASDKLPHSKRARRLEERIRSVAEVATGVIDEKRWAADMCLTDEAKKRCALALAAILLREVTKGMAELEALLRHRDLKDFEL